MILSDHEVVGMFGRPQQFGDAVFALESAGIDRAQLTVLGLESRARECLAAADCASTASQEGVRQHDAVAFEEDDQQERVLLTSLTASVAALIAAGAALTATGGAAAPAIAAALGAVGAGGGIAECLSRRVHSARAEQLERDVRTGGIACGSARRTTLRKTRPNAFSPSGEPATFMSNAVDRARRSSGCRTDTAPV